MPSKSKTRLYKIWLNMRARCTNENHPDFKDYGGRGITVCDEWMFSYDSFEEWAYNAGYREYLTIDRTDNDAGYSPSNCRWATRLEQTHNRRERRDGKSKPERRVPLYEIDGVLKSSYEWSNIAGISQNTFLTRWYAGKRGQELLLPAKKRRPKKK